MPRPRRAFTALELLAATALTALLLLAVFHVVGALGRSRAAVERRAAGQGAGVDAPWLADLLDTLRRDLAGAATIRYDEGGVVVLSGHTSLDRATLVPGDGPAVVRYEVVTVHGRRWLCRRQSPRDGFAGGGAGWTELLCPDVTGFSLRPVAGPLTPAPAAPLVKDSAEGQPVPPAVVVRVDSGGVPVVERVLTVR